MYITIERKIRTKINVRLQVLPSNPNNNIRKYVSKRCTGDRKIVKYVIFWISLLSTEYSIEVL